ncbi:MAG: ATP/GTP-binding protein, partial [Schaalia hyovaginalis]|nr:ATP/GTP-binding protein [Schaalia hyovaginalis]
SALVAHKLLETVFGDQAVRSMAKAARKDLEERMREALAEQLEPLRSLLPEDQSSLPLTSAIDRVRAQWL